MRYSTVYVPDPHPRELALLLSIVVCMPGSLYIENLTLVQPPAFFVALFEFHTWNRFAGPFCSVTDVDYSTLHGCLFCNQMFIVSRP